MEIPNFHDGYFDGIWVGPNKLVEIFLRTTDRQPFVLSLQGVQALTFTGIKQGNIVLDLVFRNAKEITHSDISELYGVSVDSPQVVSLTKSATEQGLQVLEINPSYGAQGLVLFQSWDISQREVQP
ncbi:MAG TPA: hypothetical protein VN830_03980 [Verrucomicrobiae bacterium]|nr:hypothetical protein [Verrucomicrobiae bacterium]